MTELTITDPCILFPLFRESNAFRREFRPTQAFPNAPCQARFCGPAWLSTLVVHTGIGKANLQKALDWILSEPRLGDLIYQPKVIILAGFAGALQEGFKVGDIILAKDIVDEQGGHWSTTWPDPWPQGQWQPTLHPGRILATDRLVCTAEEKHRLGSRYEAQAVDMESSAFALACSKKNIPFGILRVISDNIHTQLSPQLLSIFPDGKIHMGRLLGGLLRKPALFAELWRLKNATALAGSLLGKALGELLTLTLPWSEELDS